MSLDEYIPTIGFNITKFNEYVKTLVAQLAARGERTDDLLINLFKRYLAAPDKEFATYIKEKQSKYYEGEQINWNDLMQLAKEKYEVLVEGKTWNAPSLEEEKIIALESRFNKFQKGSKKGKWKDEGKKRKIHDGKKKEKPYSLTKPPKESEKDKTIAWNGMTWHWCGKATGGKCERWRCHKGKDCKGKGFKPGTDTRKVKEEDSNKRLKLSKALEAIIEESNNDEWE